MISETEDKIDALVGEVACKLRAFLLEAAERGATLRLEIDAVAPGVDPLRLEVDVRRGVPRSPRPRVGVLSLLFETEQ